VDFFIFNPFVFNILIIIVSKKKFMTLARLNNVVAPHAMARQYPLRQMAFPTWKTLSLHSRWLIVLFCRVTGSGMTRPNL
jgi:hypothetical protein